jgi:hypothetical protein
MKTLELMPSGSGDRFDFEPDRATPTSAATQRSAANLVSIWAADPPVKLKVVTVAEVAAEVQRLKAERDDELRRLAKGTWTATKRAPNRAEDLSGRPLVYQMIEGVDDGSGEMIAGMVRIAVKEGFFVVAQVLEPDLFMDLHRLSSDERKHLVLAPFADFPGQWDPWTEDAASPNSDGSMTIVPPASNDLIKTATQDGRKARIEKLEADEGLTLDLGVSAGGNAALTEAYRTQVRFGLMLGAKNRLGLAYLEGGNVVSGHFLDGSTYAVVGADSVAIAKAQLAVEMERVTGEKPRPLTDEEVKAVIASDLGLPTALVFVVEQPRSFHIDMAMKPLGPGVMMLDDARAARRLQLTILARSLRQALTAAGTPPPGGQVVRDLMSAFILGLRSGTPEGVRRVADALRASDVPAPWAALARSFYDAAELTDDIYPTTEKQAIAEDYVAKQLAQAGLQVVRAPCRFMNGAGLEIANFANAECGTNASGGTFYITQGADPGFGAGFEQALQSSGVEIDQFHYLDRAASVASLSARGGINCRTTVVRETTDLLPPASGDEVQR